MLQSGIASGPLTADSFCGKVKGNKVICKDAGSSFLRLVFFYGKDYNEAEGGEAMKRIMCYGDSNTWGMTRWKPGQTAVLLPVFRKMCAGPV